MTKHIPNLFTLLNLVFGCAAIIAILQNGLTIEYVPDDSQLNEMLGKIWMQPASYPEANQLVYLSDNLIWASVFIFLAAIVDFLDGFVASLFKASSEMGKHLDSLADVVSFGVAPSMIMYQLLRFSFMKEPEGLQVSIWYLLPALFIACAGAYRLARFNIDNSQSFGFKGLPIPAAGILIASLPLLLHVGSSVFDVHELLGNKWLLYGLILLVSGLMVSTLPLMALKFKDFTIQNNIPKLILLGVAAIAAIFLHWLAIPVTILVYIILSLAIKQQPHELHSKSESDAVEGSA